MHRDEAAELGSRRGVLVLVELIRTDLFEEGIRKETGKRSETPESSPSTHWLHLQASKAGLPGGFMMGLDAESSFVAETICPLW